MTRGISDPKYLVVCPDDNQLKMTFKHCLHCYACNGYSENSKNGLVIDCKPLCKGRQKVKAQYAEDIIDW